MPDNGTIELAGALNGALDLDGELNGTVEVPKEGKDGRLIVLYATITETLIIPGGGHTFEVTVPPDVSGLSQGDYEQSVVVVSGLAGPGSGAQVMMPLTVPDPEDQYLQNSLIYICNYNSTESIILSGYRSNNVWNWSVSTSETLSLIGANSMKAILQMGLHRIVYLANGIDEKDAVNKGQLDSAISATEALIPTTPSDIGAAPAAAAVPSGGTAGQVLKKTSDDNYDADWADEKQEIFWVQSTSPATTVADMEAAFNADKLLVYKRSSSIRAPLAFKMSTLYYFSGGIFRYNAHDVLRMYICDNGSWSHRDIYVDELLNISTLGIEEFKTKNTYNIGDIVYRDDDNKIYRFIKKHNPFADQLSTFEEFVEETSIWELIDARMLQPTSADSGDVLTYNGSKWVASPPSGGGTTDYTDLTNKPSINNVTLNGNKSLSDLGIVPEVFWATKPFSTNAQIEAAYQAGKLCLMNDDGDIYIMGDRTNANQHWFYLVTGPIRTFNGVRNVHDKYFYVEDDNWYGITLDQPIPDAATATPSNLGTAAVGSSAKYAKEDHVHNMPAISTAAPNSVGTALVGTAVTAEPNYTPTGVITPNYSYNSTTHRLVFTDLTFEGTGVTLINA